MAHEKRKNTRQLVVEIKSKSGTYMVVTTVLAKYITENIRKNPFFSYIYLQFPYLQLW